MSAYFSRLPVLAALAGAMLASPLVVAAQSTPPDVAAVATAEQPLRTSEPAAWWRGITVNGFVSGSYSHNYNDPGSNLNQFRVFDFHDDSPTLDVAELVVQHTATKPGDFGFRFDFEAGSAIPEMEASYGLFRGKQNGIAHHYDFQQAFVSYVAPVGKGLRFDAGKFVTHFGYEVIEGYDGYNDNVTRSFQFGYAIPFTHTGVKTTYALSDRVSAMFLVANGWDAFHDNNTAKTIGGQVALTPSKSTAVYVNWVHGAEGLNNNHDHRDVGELVAIWKPTGRVSFAVDGVYGHEENAAALGHDAIWKGFAGYAKYALTDQFSMAFRGEVFADNGGTRTGIPQTLQAYTLTPEYSWNTKFSRISPILKKLDGKFVLRGDLRLDHSDEMAFQTEDHFRKNQVTSAVNIILVF